MLRAVRVLFVCLGNICRSPTAEAVMRALAREAALTETLEVDSAGTAAYHVGEAPDRRSVAAAARRGITLEGSARQVRAADFERFDLVVAMDRANRDELIAIAPGERAAAKVRLLREYDAAAVAAGTLDVPDPYYGGPSGFDDVLDVVEAACRSLLGELQAAAPPAHRGPLGAAPRGAARDGRRASS